MILPFRHFPPGIDAMTLGPLILIRPECRNDAALLAHERVHQGQQRRWLWLPWFVLYLLWPRFRLRAEVEAYRVQADIVPDHVDILARILATAYRLDLSQARARELISGTEDIGLI